MAQQRPVLHQAKHESSPRGRIRPYWFVPSSIRLAVIAVRASGSGRINAAIGGEGVAVRSRFIRYGLIIGAALGGPAFAGELPLPRPRPAEAAPAAVEMTPSACQLRLTAIAQFETMPPRPEANGCGAADLVRISAVQLAVGAVTISPPAELRCEMAEQVALWIRDDAAPQFAPDRLAGIENYDSYDCRARNRVIGAKMSEHGKGNALDVRAFELASGKRIEPTDVTVDHALRTRLRELACARFTTVLGPGSDGHHEAHIHVDLANRHNGYRICHWMVNDPGTVGAGHSETPLPPPRPYDLNDKPNASPTK